MQKYGERLWGHNWADLVLGFFTDLYFSETGDPVAPDQVNYPCVVKASKGEDTKAVRLVKDQQSLHAAIEHALSYSDHVIIERWEIVPGNELFI